MQSAGKCGTSSRDELVSDQKLHGDLSARLTKLILSLIYNLVGQDMVRAGLLTGMDALESFHVFVNIRFDREGAYSVYKSIVPSGTYYTYLLG